MKRFYDDINALSRRGRIFFAFFIILSVFYKLFFLLTQQTNSGPDCAEYNHLADLFSREGIIGYIKSDDPFTFWRLPVLPFILYVTRTHLLFYILQLVFSYFLAYNFYAIMRQVTGAAKVSIACFLAIVFLPYINNAACARLTEFLQISLFIYAFRKVLYKEYDIWMLAALTAFCLLRAEGQYLVYFLVLRELFLRNFKKIPLYIIPIVFTSLWCVRNNTMFGEFKLVNPILSARALIGSLYGFIYVRDPGGFHTKHDYYKGRDYKNSKAFVEAYQKTVKYEITNKLLTDPLSYAGVRAYQIAHAFLYFGFNLEHLPDDNWSYPRGASYRDIVATNSEWAYKNILEEKDYSKLIVRILYNGSFALMHLLGFLFLFINYRKLLPLIFILLNFSFVLIVEVDMRYLITMQATCVCAFILMLYSLKRHKTFLLSWVKKNPINY